MASIVIIGGGVSGLSAGIYSSALGHRVTLLEAGATVGGNLTGWQREGYKIDNCIHWLTGTNENSDTYKIWDDLFGISDMEIVKCDTLYTYSEDDVALSLYRDLEKTEAELLKISPEDKKEILDLTKAVSAMRYIADTDGKDKAASLKEKALAVKRLAKYSTLTVGDMARRFKSRYIRGFLCSFITEHFAALALITVFSHFAFGNADIPKGGSLEVSERMRERFIASGGKIRVNSEVKRINVECGIASSVTLLSGEVIEADYIVVTADPKTVYGRLLSEKMPTKLSKRYENSTLMRFSSFQCAFAAECERLPFSGDFCFRLPRRDRLRLGVEYITLREFSHERNFTPDGKSLIQTILFLGEDASLEFIRLRAENYDAYLKKKSRLSKIVEGAIIDKFPALKSKIRLLDAWTPATYKRYIRSEIGSYMSFAFGKGFIPTTLNIGSRLAKNIIFATQWQTPPGGLPIAAMRGKAAAEKIAKLEAKLSAGIFREKRYGRRYRSVGQGL